MHGFLEFVDGIDFEHKVEMGIRKDRYKAMVPQVVGPLKLKGRVHQVEARLARRHTKKKLKITLPGPMTIVDTVADRYYGDRVKMAMAFADLLNQEARALQADGVDVIQFDEPAFNVYIDDVKAWGITALDRAAEGLTCMTVVHICYGYGIKANIDWKATLGSEWRQYEEIFPAIAKSTIKAVSLECMNSQVPMHLMKLLEGKDLLVGVIDVASDVVETPEQVADTIGKALQFVAKEHLFPCTNCGMAPMKREIALAKLAALGKGAELARERYGDGAPAHSLLPPEGALSALRSGRAGTDMSRRTLKLNDRLHDYVVRHNREHPELAKLREATASHPRASMQISPEQGALLRCW